MTEFRRVTALRAGEAAGPLTSSSGNGSRRADPWEATGQLLQPDLASCLYLWESSEDKGHMKAEA